MVKKNLEESTISIVDSETPLEIPQQTEFYKLPTRFGAVPVDAAPLGWEVETRRRETKITKFEHAYPRIYLPFQEVQRIEFDYGDKFEQTELFPKGANRLFFGDNLHIMRQLPSKSIDLIYIDPPFFSGRNYNVIFGDKNEVRSFTDIWEGGMPGYLIWLNARLYEMKRLLKETGSIYVHLDWHASHYVKVEMDKIFGADNFKREIVWATDDTSGFKSQAKNWIRAHDVILFYSRSNQYKFNKQYSVFAHKEDYIKRFKKKDKGRLYRDDRPGGRKQYLDETLGKAIGDVWDDIMSFQQASTSSELIGYPTQKPSTLLDRIIRVCTDENDVVADFFCGGGTTPATAQLLNRRWIASDQSRIAVSVTQDRMNRLVEEKIGKLFAVPDFTVEHWGIYESPRLEKLPKTEFREFVIKAFGGKSESVSPNIHGVRHGVPLFVGEPTRNSRITKDDVAKFAEAIFKERRTNFGAMLGWNFAPDARKAAEILAARENKRIDFVRLNLVRLEDDAYREHITTKHKDYNQLLSFIQPPEVRISYERISKLKYRFDVSESVSLNKDGVIANVQWDFDYKNRFSSSEGFAFLRDKKSGKPILVVEYEFSGAGKKRIAFSVQDDQGGERTEIIEIEVK
ncbi:MAG: site-specific DNA-methyltransferase [Bacteroidota bacterium]|nr:site-specific DNA-methyltransferase [Bacteroidota bacterium]